MMSYLGEGALCVMIVLRALWASSDSIPNDSRMFFTLSHLHVLHAPFLPPGYCSYFFLYSCLLLFN